MAVTLKYIFYINGKSHGRLILPEKAGFPETTASSAVTVAVEICCIQNAVEKINYVNQS